MHGIALHCSAQSIGLNCTALHYIALHCIALPEVMRCAGNTSDWLATLEFPGGGMDGVLIKCFGQPNQRHQARSATSCLPVHPFTPLPPYSRLLPLYTPFITLPPYIS